MIGGQACFILLSALAVIQTFGIPQINMTEAELGKIVVLRCIVSKDLPALFYWHKIKCGYMFETVANATFKKTSLQEQFKDSRFDITREDNVYSLTIRNVTKEDEAMYFCQAGSAYEMKLFNGTYLAVNDPKNKHNTVRVEQNPHVEIVPLGHNMTLQCSFQSKNTECQQHCPDETRVFWYRSGTNLDTGFIYTDSSSSDKQAGRCVSRLSKTIHNPSDAGNYYCAVVKCGEILFGEGTKVKIREEFPFVFVLGSLLACSVLVNVVLIITRRKKTPTCKVCKGKLVRSSCSEQNGPTADQPSNMDGEDDEINYAALDFSSRTSKRLKRNKEISSDCTYSSMREYR